MVYFWATIPEFIPFDGQLCWIRVKYYYSNPFLATWDETNQQFISLLGGIIYPAWTIARWRENESATPLTVLIQSDQTPLNTFVMSLAGWKYFNYSIDWGDNSVTTGHFTGDVEVFSHAYSIAGFYDITISVPSPSITYFDINQEPLFGDLPVISPFKNLTYVRLRTWSAATAFYTALNFPQLQYLYMPSNQLTGTFPSISNCASLLILSCITNDFTGDMPDPSNCPLLQKYRLDGCDFTGNCPSFLNNPNIDVIRIAENSLNGEMSQLSHLSLLDELYISNCGFTGAFPVLNASAPTRTLKIDTNSFNGWTSWVPPLVCTEFWAQGNAFPEASVNQILADFATNLAARPAVGTILLQGGTNAAPTGQGLIDKAAIQAHGWTVTTN